MTSLHLYIIIPLFFIGCTQQSIDLDKNVNSTLVKTYGSDNSFDIATWNLKEFPLHSTLSVHYLAQIIRDLDIDLFGIQEIKEEPYFHQLIDSLDDYSGIISLSDNYLKYGIIYKKDLISVSNIKELYLTDYDTLPRPPLLCYVEVKNNGTTIFDFSLIIVHLKAYSGIENEMKRRISCNKLKEFIDTQLLTEEEKDIIILGDWNDEVDDLPEENIFSQFIEDSLDYKILTAVIDNQYSYISTDSLYDSLIDHILITHDAMDEYGNGHIYVLYLDREFSQYTEYISDHRPVLARFFCF